MAACCMSFFKALGNLSIRCRMAKPGAASVAHSRRSSASMSLHPAIPWRVALPQSPPPLPRPTSGCCNVVLPAD